MKHLKQGIAAFLAALLIMPTLPAAAEGTTAPAASEADQVWFNTGNLAVSVIDPSVSENEAYQSQWMDLFAEDGSYTINIPEENPFFPYEVQFTCNGETTNEWFMNPEDTVEVGGHTFHVSAYFDNTAVTQMSLKVGGQQVTVYPEEKAFTNDGNGVAEQSLLPLTQRYLTVDLTKFTPVELTQVSTASVFTGANALTSTDKIAWTYSSDNYTVTQSADNLNLSKGTYFGTSTTWTMIVGSADQLDLDDIKYYVNVKHTSTEKWLQASVYTQDSTGKRNVARTPKATYYDYDTARLSINYETYTNDKYLGLQINPEVFGNPQYASLKVYEGNFETASEAMQAKDITSQIMPNDMGVLNAGYPWNGDPWIPWITFVSFDATGTATGCLPVRMQITAWAGDVRGESLCNPKETTYPSVYDSSSSSTKYLGEIGDIPAYEQNCVYTMTKSYPANGTYALTLRYDILNDNAVEYVQAAYSGVYNSIQEAQAAGATDIKDSLFATDRKNGYQADYSKGVTFTVFVQPTGTSNKEIWRYTATTQEAKSDAGTNLGQQLSSSTAVQFNGLNDKDGNPIACYTVKRSDDSYGEYNYHMIVVPAGTDLTRVAPVFTTKKSVKLYAEGSNSPEVSGESYHDISSGILQYTASAEDGVESKNYWLQIITATGDKQDLFINSFSDPASHTEVKDGVIYSTREVMIDSYHNNRHDIFLANRSTQAIQNIKTELVSDTLQMDEYWSLTGNEELKGASTAQNPENIAKIRLKAKDGVEAGTEVSGTLTIKSGDKTLIVLTLTGIVGDPVITTTDIPEAIKYVPYGTMIQNNNKYSWNKVEYQLVYGELPEGMELKANGEIYGVPQETGEYTFMVRMKNGSQLNRSSCSKMYTLTVLENTNENVENATDEGYGLKERVPTIYIGSESSGNYVNSYTSQMMVSNGVFSEYRAVYLDGNKLVEGQDYSAASGSTRIALLTSTLRNVDTTKKEHTLAIEFRTAEGDLKRAAQNYAVVTDGSSSGDNNSSENDTDSESSDSTGAVVTVGTVQTITYTIQPGDTLSKIAKKYLGNASLWRKIYEDNKATIKNPNLIRVGQKLIINLSGNAVGGAKTTAVSSNANTYVVQPGDNLWKIAKKVYGQGFAWRRIFEANRNVISNPGTIHVGQQLLTP